MFKIFKLLTIVTKLFILDVCRRSGYTSVVGVQFGTLTLEIFAGLSVSLCSTVLNSFNLCIGNSIIIK